MKKHLKVIAVALGLALSNVSYAACQLKAKVICSGDECTIQIEICC